MKRRSLVLAGFAVVTPLLSAQTAPTAAQLANGIVQRYTAVLNLSSTQQDVALTIFTTEETSELAIHTAEQSTEKTLLSAVEADDTATIATVSATLGGLNGQDVQARATAYGAFYGLCCINRA